MINIKKTGFLFLLCTLIALTGISQTKYYVNDNSTVGDKFCTARGLPANPGTTAATPKSKLSDIISAYQFSFTQNDTIFVDVGDYSDRDINMPINKPGICIKGAGLDLTNFASHSGGQFIFINSSNTTLMNFKVTDYSGMGLIINGGFPQMKGIVIKNVIFDDCGNGSEPSIKIEQGSIVHFSGGGATCNKTDPTLSGGDSKLFWIKGSVSYTTNVLIEDYAISGVKGNSGGMGNCLLIEGANVEIKNTIFTKNNGENVGSLIYCKQPISGGGLTNPTIKLTDCKILDNFGGTVGAINSSTDIGTFISIQSGVTFIASKSVFENNGLEIGSGYSGGMFGVKGGVLQIDSCYFKNNYGGGDLNGTSGQKRGNDIYINSGKGTVKNSVFAGWDNAFYNLYGNSKGITNTDRPLGAGAWQNTGPSSGNAIANSSTLTIENSGAPAVSPTYSFVTFLNTTSPTYTPAPTTPIVTGACPSVTITNNPACPSAGTSASLTVCDFSSTNLYDALGTPKSASGDWTYNAVSSPTLSGGHLGVFTPTATGTYNYTYTIPANGACTSTTAIVSVYVLPKPAGTGTGITLCGGSTYTLLPLLNAGISTGTWSPTLGGGSLGIVSPTLAGTYSYTYSVTSSVCLSYTSSIVTISVAPNPAGVNSSTAICANSSINLVDVIGATSTGGGWTTSVPTNPTLTGGYLGTFTSSTTSTFNYTYTVPASSSCSLAPSSAVVTLTVNPNPSAILSYTNPSCGKNNGNILITNNSVGNFTYTSSSGVLTGQNVTGLSPGTVTITVSNEFACKFTAAETLTNSAGPTDFSLTPVHETCSNTIYNTKGELTFGNVIGGIAPYTYSVNGVAKTSTISATFTTNVNSLSAGVYTVELEDAVGCIYTKTTTIYNLKPTAISGTASLAGCSSADGTYTITNITDDGLSVSNYSFTIDGSASVSNVIGGLTVGTHTLVVTNTQASSCPFTTTININANNTLTITGISVTDASCGLSNGSATVSVSGGNGSYTYSNTANSQTVATITGMNAGNYYVTVTDGNLCNRTEFFKISNNSTFTASVVGSSSVTCHSGANGSFSLTTNTSTLGGIITYSVDMPGAAAQTQTANPGSQVEFTGFSAGNYHVNVIEEQTGCLVPLTIAISQPTAALSVLGLSGDTYTTSCHSVNTSTNTNAHLVSFSVTSTGANTYSYNINGGTIFQVSPVFTGVPAGDYIIGVTGPGCITTATAVIHVLEPTPISLSSNTILAKCTPSASGSATVSATGGKANYSYSWTPIGSTTSILTTSVLTNAIAGNHSVMVTDANSCQQPGVITIGNHTAGIAIISSSAAVTCKGSNTGSLTADIQNGPGGTYTVSWTPSGKNTFQVTGLAAGEHTCTITDFNGCSAIVTASLSEATFSLTAANFASQPVQCYKGNKGTIIAGATGGVVNNTSDYTYLWSSTNTQTGLAVTVGTLATISNTNIIAGTYTCTITDLANCSITQTVQVDEPLPISLTTSVTPAGCNQTDGVVSYTASGGTILIGSSYLYSFNGGVFSNAPSTSSLAAGSYSIIVKDDNACEKTFNVTVNNPNSPILSVASQSNISCFGKKDGIISLSVTPTTNTHSYMWSASPTQTSSIATNLPGGIITVTVTDVASTCQSIGTYTITEPTKLEVLITNSVNPTCFGFKNGYGSALATGGTSNYTYSWSSPSTVTVTNNGAVAVNSGTLGGGIHYVTVTDAHQCVTTQSMALTDPNPVSVSITTQSITCFGLTNGSAIATATDGVAPYNYSWTGGLNPVNSATLSNVKTGNYTITATDKNGCIGKNVAIISEPAKLTLTNVITGSVSCNGGKDGFISVTPTGGIGSYTQTIVSSTGISSSNSNSLTVGNYTITIKDANGCSEKLTTRIDEPTKLVTVATHTNVKCKGGCDAMANISFSGGIGIPNFIWLPGLQSGNIINNLCAGTHTVMISSNSGKCTSSITINVTEPNAILNAITTPSNSNCGQSNGKACVSVSGGAAPYTFKWSNGEVTSCMNNVKANTYTVAITDANGCTKIASASISDITGPKIVIQNTTAVSCFGGRDGKVSVNVSGGVPTYNISWSDGHKTLNVTDFTEGLKTLTIVDQAGCKSTEAVFISEPKKLVSAITTSIDVTCFGANDGRAIVSASDGTSPYTYSWTPSLQTNSVAINLTANIYTATVTDNNGCLSLSLVKINQPSKLKLNAPVISNITCFGSKNGSILVPAQGGNLPYTYSWTPGSFGNINSIGGLLPDNYSLHLVDSKNCVFDTLITIIEPPLLTSSYVSKPATCGLTNGSATVTISGGTPTYSVLWNLPGLPTGSLAINMPPGNNWTANVRDSKGCLTTQTVSVAKPPLPSIVSSTAVDPTCFGGSNGSMSITFGSGVAPYKVIWPSPISKTVTPITSTEPISGVSAGSYNVIVQDANGCEVSKPIYVSQPSELSLVVTSDTKICYGQGIQISANATGGTPGYSYIWIPNTYSGTGPHLVSPTSVTNYTVHASDSKGCSPVSAKKVITIDVSPILTAIGNTDTICHGQSTILTPNILSAGNSGPYSYVGYPGVVTYTGTALLSQTTNTFGVTVTDGCTIPNSLAIFTIVTNPLPTANITASTTETCVPVEIELTATPGTPGNYTYMWTTDNKEIMGTTNPTAYTFNAAGNYMVNLNLTNTTTGCSNDIVKSNFILINDKPKAAFITDPQTTTVLDPIVNFINQSQDAVSYYWDFGDGFASKAANTSTLTNSMHVYSETGKYRVHLVATSAKGCKDTTDVILEIKPDFVIYIPNSFTPDGNGLNETFQPMGIGIDEENYRMDIFDRWGENIFSSIKFREGWDGTVKGGKKAPQGTYIYKILIIDYKGNKHPYIGHVNVLSEN